MKKENKKNKKYSLNYLLDFVTDLIVVGIKKINKFLSNKKTNVIVKSIVRVLLCMIILSLLEIPFFVIDKIGTVIISMFTLTFREMFTNIWQYVVHYTWLLVTLIILFKVILDMSKRKEYKIEIKEKDKFSDGLYSSIINLIKVLISITLIPLILVTLLLFAILGMLVCFITNGIIIIGPILVVAGLIIIAGTILSYISDIVYFDEGGKK